MVKYEQSLSNILFYFCSGMNLSLSASKAMSVRSRMKELHSPAVGFSIESVVICPCSK